MPRTKSAVEIATTPMQKGAATVGTTSCAGQSWVKRFLFVARGKEEFLLNLACLSHELGTPLAASRHS